MSSRSIKDHYKNYVRVWTYRWFLYSFFFFFSIFNVIYVRNKNSKGKIYLCLTYIWYSKNVAMPHYIPKKHTNQKHNSRCPLFCNLHCIRFSPNSNEARSAAPKNYVSQYVEKPDCDVRKLNSLLSIKWSPEAGTPSWDQRKPERLPSLI